MREIIRSITQKIHECNILFVEFCYKNIQYS